jgi:P4 family phage/plasmid primase-like protien
MQLVKRLTGDATLKARRMRQDFFEFGRTHKTVMVTNNRPRVREDSEAVWRRLHLVPFNVVIPKEERDPKLLEKLRGEWAGILAWLVRGCIECQRDGLKPPQAVLAATAEYRGVEDAVGRFIEERCVLDPGETPPDERSTTTWKSLFGAYTAWCEASGEKPMNARRLGEALDKRGLTTETQRIGSKTAKVRAGIRLCEATGGSQEESPW